MRHRHFLYPKLSIALAKQSTSIIVSALSLISNDNPRELCNSLASLVWTGGEHITFSAVIYTYMLTSTMYAYLVIHVSTYADTYKILSQRFAYHHHHHPHLFHRLSLWRWLNSFVRRLRTSAWMNSLIISNPSLTKSFSAKRWVV